MLYLQMHSRFQSILTKTHKLQGTQAST
uniref:Uncharacterized protein n=1 Tax=Rhizophora mucronata TaxID=61149 RepID=A0A2P2P1R1_RHIMU